MALSDCEKCWDTPCHCGWQYRDKPTTSMTKWIHDIIKDRDDVNVITYQLYLLHNRGEETK